MGAFNVDEKNWPAAEEYFECAARADPNLTEAHYGVGMALVNQGKNKEAIGFLQTALQLDPESYEAHYVLGNSLLNLKDFPAAINQYREALRIKPDYHEVLSNLGVALGQMGDLPQAVATFESLVAKPERCGWRTGLGTALLQSGRGSEAIRQFEEVLKLPNASPTEVAMFSNNLAWLYATSADENFRNPQRAQELGCQAAAADPQSGMFQNTLGVAEYRAGNWEGAIAAMEKSIELRDGGDAIDRFVLAMACHGAGHEEEARCWFDKGNTWVARHQPVSADTKRFQQEAEQMFTSRPAAK